MEFVSFEDIAVDFTWQEWQDLDVVQRNLYRDVMLENYTSLMFLGNCMTKPELIVKLEHGFPPWSVKEGSVQRFPELTSEQKMYWTKTDDFKQCQNAYHNLHHTCHQGTNTGEKLYECGTTLISRSNFTKHQCTHSGEKPCECGKTFISHSHLNVHHRPYTEADSTSNSWESWLACRLFTEEKEQAKIRREIGKIMANNMSCTAERSRCSCQAK